MTIQPIQPLYRDKDHSHQDNVLKSWIGGKSENFKDIATKRDTNRSDITEKVEMYDKEGN